MKDKGPMCNHRGGGGGGMGGSNCAKNTNVFPENFQVVWKHVNMWSLGMWQKPVPGGWRFLWSLFQHQVSRVVVRVHVPIIEVAEPKRAPWRNTHAHTVDRRGPRWEHSGSAEQPDRSYGGALSGADVGLTLHNLHSAPVKCSFHRKPSQQTTGGHAPVSFSHFTSTSWSGLRRAARWPQPTSAPPQILQSK